jgi:hypothetical protein
MHQINDAALYILGTKTKKSGPQLRRFDNAHHKWCNLEAEEEPQTLKGPTT